MAPTSAACWRDSKCRTADMGEFQKFLVGLGYDHVHEDDNAAYSFFLR